MLIVPSKRAVLLNSPNPSQILDLVPKSQLVPPDRAQGMNVAVRHGVEEARLLRNLGFEVPSPIKYTYDWPGPFTPFDHQIETAAFMTMHRRGFVLNDMGCVDASTEYLSPTGWRRIDEYEAGPVAQYVPETGAVEFVEPTEYVKKPCPEMIRIKTSRGVDQLLSPEHRVLYVTSTGKRMVKQAHEVEAAHRKARYGWKGRILTTFSPDESLPGIELTDEQLRVQVAVIADGHFDKSTDWVVLRLKKQRKIDRLIELLDGAGIAWRTTAGPDGFSAIRFHAPWRVKEFGEAFWAADSHQLQVIADECWRWDGAERKGEAVEFFSTSKQSADFIQYAFSATGRTARVSEDVRTDRSTCYVVHARNKAAKLYVTGVGADGEKTETIWREPSPDGHKYCFMVPSTFLLLRRNGCVFATGNTGKSASALWAADYLMREGLVRRVLIVTPLSTLERVWSHESFKLLTHRKTVILHGNRDKRLALFNSDWELAVINFDGVKIIDELVTKDPTIDMVIVDEASNAYRNARTKRYKAFKAMLRKDMRLWLMTGTPCPTDPTDAWAQAKLVNPGGVPAYFGSFKRSTMTQVTQFKWLPRPEGYKIAYAAMQPAIRFKKEDCLTLPPVTYQQRDVELSKEQKDVYANMKKRLKAEAGENQLTAVNAADRLNKLRQICCGAVKDTETGEYIPLDFKPRLNVLLESIEDAGAKVIVIVPFKGIIYELATEVSKHHTVGVLNGDVTPKKRNEVLEAFKMTDSPHVLLCHPEVMAHGLTLTEADMMIFYAPIYSNELYQQVTERINRPGQKNKMTIVQLGANKLEWGIYKVIEDRKKGQDSILSLYREVMDS